jgi:hypothetical protein
MGASKMIVIVMVTVTVTSCQINRNLVPISGLCVARSATLTASGDEADEAATAAMDEQVTEADFEDDEDSGIFGFLLLIYSSNQKKEKKLTN